MRQKTRSWKKVAGKFRDKGKIYGPGQKDGLLVERPAHWIPEPGDPSWEPVDGAADKPAPPKFEKSLELVSLPGGYYNVVNSDTGEPLNDKGLRHEAAADLVEAEGFVITDEGTIVPQEEEVDGDDQNDDPDDDEDGGGDDDDDGDGED